MYTRNGPSSQLLSKFGNALRNTLMEHYPKFFGARTRSHWADLEGMLTSSAFRQDVLLRTWEAFSDGRPSCLEFAVAARSAAPSFKTPCSYLLYL